MARRTYSGLIALSTLTLLLLPLARNGTSKTTSPVTPSADNDTISYDAGFSRWVDAPHTVEMSQGVSFRHQDESLKMDSAIVNLDTNQRALSARSLSPVHLSDASNDLTGNEGFVDFTQHIATLKQNIVLIAKPSSKTASTTQGSLRNRFKDPATLTCQIMTYDYRKKIGTVPGPLTVHSGGRVLTADSGIYDSNTQLVTLTGHVHGSDADGNQLQGPNAVMYVKEGEEEITLQGPLHGKFYAKDASDDPSTPAETKIIDYNAGFSRWRNEPHTVEMNQGVTFQHEDASLKMESAVVNLDKDQQALSAQSQSPVKLVDTENDLTGTHGFVDFTQHIATLKDNVVLIAKPGPKNSAGPPGSVRSRFKDPATLTCDLMNYNYRTKIGTVPGPLTVHSGGRVLTADSGIYDSKAQLVTLTGNVHGLDADGNKLQGPSAEMSVKEGEETVKLRGPLHGTFQIKQDNATSSAAPPAPTKSPKAKKKP